MITFSVLLLSVGNALFFYFKTTILYGTTTKPSLF